MQTFLLSARKGLPGAPRYLPLSELATLAQQGGDLGRWRIRTITGSETLGRGFIYCFLADQAPPAPPRPLPQARLARKDWPEAMADRRVLITGGNGRLAWELRRSDTR